VIRYPRGTLRPYYREYTQVLPSAVTVDSSSGHPDTLRPDALPIRVPFNRPCIVGNEAAYMAEAVRNGHISGDGPFTRRCSELLEAELGVGKVLLTTSATHALELSALLLGIEPGDEIIVPSYTFVSTVNAFVVHGARPVFVDIRSDTLNLDEGAIEGLITSRTKAIVPVHYAGVGCEMDSILDIATRHGIAVVEDNAHGLFARFRGRYLGTFGQLGVQSFHETKNFMCGEGGALLVNDPALVARAEILREKGTNRSRFFRGEVDRYTWVDVGSSYLPSDILAAILYAQLEGRERIQERRRQIWDTYAARLGRWAEERDIGLPTAPAHCEQSYQMFYVLMPSLDDRRSLLAHLHARGIVAVFHYVPLHTSEMGARFGARPGDCPVTERVSDRLVRLPFFNDLAAAEQQDVVDAICAWKP
jgi:dTDP-4-amino-4,6-dideoxygalactose transaminase